MLNGSPNLNKGYICCNNILSVMEARLLVILAVASTILSGCTGLNDYTDDESSQQDDDLNDLEEKVIEKMYNNAIIHELNILNQTNNVFLSESYPPFFNNPEITKMIRNSADQNHYFDFLNYSVHICTSVEGVCLTNYNNETIDYDTNTSMTISSNGRIVAEYIIGNEQKGIYFLTSFERNTDYFTLIFRLQTEDISLDSYNNTTHTKVHFFLSNETISESTITHINSRDDQYDPDRLLAQLQSNLRVSADFISSMPEQTYVLSSFLHGNLSNDSSNTNCNYLISIWELNGSIQPLFCTENYYPTIIRTINNTCFAISNNDRRVEFRDDICFMDTGNVLTPYQLQFHANPFLFEYYWTPYYLFENEEILSIQSNYPTEINGDPLENKHLSPININPWIETEDQVILIMSSGLNYIEEDAENYMTWVFRFSKDTGELIRTDIYETESPHSAQSAFFSDNNLCLNILKGNSKTDYHAVNKFPDSQVSYSLTSSTYCGA